MAYLWKVAPENRKTMPHRAIVELPDWTSVRSLLLREVAGLAKLRVPQAVSYLLSFRESVRQSLGAHSAR
jgi:hypothetical protein